MKIVAGVMCPALPSNLWPSKKVAVMKESPKHSATQATDHGARETARTQKACFGYLASTSWLLGFLIVVLGQTARRQDDEARARKASDLLKDWSLRAVRQHIVLHVPAAADEWILHDGKVMSHDRQLNCLLFAGMEGPHDVLEWLTELSVWLVDPLRRGFSDRARRIASQLAASYIKCGRGCRECSVPATENLVDAVCSYCYHGVGLG